MNRKASERFGKIASNYASSEVHRMSPSIQHLHDVLPLSDDITLCDVACGAGHVALSFAERAKRIVGVDPAPNMLTEFQKIAKERQVSVEVIEAYAEAIPLPANTFDLVTSRLAPHHFTDIKATIKEMVRVARPGGYVAVIDLEGHTDPSMDDFNHQLEILHDPTHIRSYTAKQWQIFFEEAGLSVEVLKGNLTECPGGLRLHRWCEIACSGEEAETKIFQLLNVAEDNVLDALGITREGNEFLMPVRTVLILGRKHP
ncbi:MAG: methyltransferase domain-containing protein [Stigonema ocellatum SAG 48.90 = DSM 106950]|nr:methyltransferase domain-containing protein [Stigonema ocellatum SAG 48.90 = DSM 106950]